MPDTHFRSILSSATLCTALYVGVVAGAASGPAHAAGNKTASVKDKVALSFAWPDNLKGSAVYSRTKTLRTARRAKKQKMTGSYDFVVRPVADGLAITSHNTKIEIDGGQHGSGTQSKLRDFIVKVASSPPGFVVTPKGEFRRIDGLQDFQKKVSEGLEAMISGYPPKVQQNVKRVVAPLISPAQLRRQMVQRWNRDVGFWTGGAEIDHGDTYVFKFVSRFPAFGSLRVPMATHFEFAERVRCTEKEKAKRCVRLETRTKIDNKELTKAIDRWVASADAAGKAKPNIKDMRIDVKVTLITDPKTLIPYRVREEKITVATAGGPKGGTAEQVQVTEIKYTY